MSSDLLDNQPVKAVELAGHIGVSDRTVRTLAQKGIVRRDSDGLYPLGDSVRAYCHHLREAAAGRTGSKGLSAQRERVAREQADALAMKNAVTRGELLSAKNVVEMWAGMCRMIRARLLAVPSRVQQRLTHLSRHDLDVIDREVRETLSELADDEL